MGKINIICILLFVLTLSYTQIHSAQQMKLDGGTFLIQNKHYPHAHLSMKNVESVLGRPVITQEGNIAAYQFWILKKSSHKSGCYYINNAYYKGFRVGEHIISNWYVSFIRANIGMFHPYQLWKFLDFGAGNYRIYNCKHKTDKLTKWGKSNSKLQMNPGSTVDGEIWKLVPRYKADISYKVLWGADNRKGSMPFSETITITYGLKLTQSYSISTKNGLEMSLKASTEVGLGGIGSASFEMETKISMELTRSLSNSREENWSRTSEIVFTAPPHKNYRVLQLYAAFRSPLASDNLALKCDYRIEESDGDF